MALTKVDKSLLETTSGTASASTFLRGDGTWSSAAAGFHKVTVFTTTTSAGGYSPDTGVTKLIVEVQGAGGAGCKSQTNTTKATSAGGGGYAMKSLTVTSSDTMTITIGSGGAAQTTNDTAGAAGGDSKFTSVTGTSFTEVKGNGGNGGTFTAYGMVLGGTASGGDLEIPGGTGTGGGMGEYGGDSMFGRGGGIMWTGQLTSNIATGYGSGGGGSYQLTSGAGMDGVVIVWEYK
tara:strand:+ start:735 stop:1436 length:702 start_codon:yes stop_codon:yes gene_type:complete